MSVMTLEVFGVGAPQYFEVFNRLFLSQYSSIRYSPFLLYVRPQAVFSHESVLLSFTK
jgi:hypothetical protein